MSRPDHLDDDWLAFWALAVGLVLGDSLRIC
jgi:hypothetical protein